MTDKEQARYAIDDAIDKWLKLYGFSDYEIADLDYSTLNEELEFYVHELKHRRAQNEVQTQ